MYQINIYKFNINIKRSDESFIPIDPANSDYQQYLKDLKTHGMSIVSCDDCGDGTPNDSMWQYLDNAEQLVIDKYGSGSDKLTALRTIPITMIAGVVTLPFWVFLGLQINE